MSTNKTPNYNLHAWTLEDDFLTSEINENFAALDTALKAEAAAAGQAVQAEAAALSQKETALYNTIAQKEAALYSAISQNVSSLNGSISWLSSSKVEMAAGVYTGDGAAQREIVLGFAPKAVLVIEQEGRMGGAYKYGGLAVQGGPANYPGSTPYPIITLTGTGFLVYSAAISSSFRVCSNHEGVVFHYLALR